MANIFKNQQSQLKYDIFCTLCSFRYNRKHLFTDQQTDVSSFYIKAKIRLKSLQFFQIQVSNKLHYIKFIAKKKMGQQQFLQLKQKFLQCEKQNTLELQSPQQLITKLQNYASQVTNKELTADHFKQHLFQYLNSQLQNSNSPKKRRRSYQLLQVQKESIEKTRSRSDSFSKQYIALQQKMQWLQEIEELVRKNITDIMVSQKSYKIRQSFRKLILSLLKLDNLVLYIAHSQGRLEFHDFKANYITYVIQREKSKNIQLLIKEYENSEVNQKVLQAFDLLEQGKSEKSSFKWGVNTENPKISLCYVWKKSKDNEMNEISNKLIKKIANIAMISSGEEEISIIQNYSKDLLELLQHCIHQSQLEISTRLGLGFYNLQELYTSLISMKEKNQPLIARVSSYQQLEFELLENIRTYKKYICEGDKIFMDFDESAELIFMSNNFNHHLTSSFTHIVGNQKFYLQKIFQNYKPINDFLKKAVQKKIKGNKLYQLDFETKARVKYNQQGRIIRLNVIIEEIEKSSSSSSNIYCSSSTKILSEQGEKPSSKDLHSQEGQIKEKRPSTLIRNLQKDNPGIINEGWINLFIKDHHIATRKNTLMRNKQGKSYAVKRSFSLNHDAFVQSQDPKAKLSHINTQSTDLNLLQLEEEQLEPLVLKVFRKLQYFHSQHINKQYFQNFLNDLHNGYQIHNNPFHNFTHGVNVMHTCYLITQATKIRQLLTPVKLFSVLFSGLCHDVGHTGFTNLFEIASRSKKAITYNDNSPLENFHAAYTFQLLKKPENNFLKDLTPQELKDFRKSVINNILFTDIKEHFPLLKKFNGIIKDEIPKNDEYTNILTSMIVHTADFGGSAKDFQICKAWSLKVNLQFSNQYKMEGQLSLTQTPFMKDLTNITILSKNQGGFLKVIVFPLYEAIDQFCGNDQKMRKLRQYAENNIKRWQQIHANSLKEQKTKQMQKKLMAQNTKDEIKQEV